MSLVRVLAGPKFDLIVPFLFLVAETKRQIEVENGVGGWKGRKVHPLLSCGIPHPTPPSGSVPSKENHRLERPGVNSRIQEGVGKVLTVRVVVGDSEGETCRQGPVHRVDTEESTGFDRSVSEGEPELFDLMKGSQEGTCSSG